jgi:hypothetical protein
MRIILWPCALLLLASLTSPPQPTNDVVSSPFYLEQTETMGDRKTTWALARQSDGTTVRIEKGERAVVRDVFLRHSAVSVFDAYKAKVVWPSGTTRQGVESQPLPGCDVNHATLPDDRPAGFDSVLGQVVTVSETTIGGTIITSWRAPGLDCEELYYRSELTQRDGSRKLVVEMTTAVLFVGDPDPALFIIDANYAEVTPSAEMLRFVEANGLPLPEGERDRLALLARQAKQ